MVFTEQMIEDESKRREEEKKINKLMICRASYSSGVPNGVEFAECQDESLKDMNNDGSIVAHIPVEWVKIRPPRQMTEEQRLEIADRLHRGRTEHKASNDPNSHENTSDDKISTQKQNVPSRAK